MTSNPVRKELEEAVAEFPRKPGVYLMKNEDGQVIYVGKAKDLRARVKNYFSGADERAQIEFLIERVRIIEKIVTATEQQALVLERDLIAKYKPRYNIKLKDDKAYLSIRVDENVEWPRLELVRRRPDDGARYFGPYSFSHELRSVLEIIKRVIPLRTCSDTVFYNRQRPCLEYQIKRCAGPCCLPVDRAEYRKWIRQAIGILEGKSDGLLTELNKQMERASSELRFEDAAVLRDRMQLLEQFKAGTSLLSFRGEARDVFAMHREEQLIALVVVSVRDGRIVESTTFSLSGVEVANEEVLEASIMQFYEKGREIPPEIFVPEELENSSILEEALSEKRGSKVVLLTPQRGVGLRLLELAQVNAKEHFLATFDVEDRYKEIARSLALLLSLRQVPRRIECVDISNFQGSDIVGAVVSFFDGEPDKNGYRKYKIKSDGKPDDFASIQEVVGRRLERGKEEGNLPDLLIIDGGPGQLAMALEARDSLGIELEIVSLAKERTTSDLSSSTIERSQERMYLEGRDEPIQLDPHHPVTHFMQRVRDEVHRFVITFHRTTRAKRVMASVLDEIPGVGLERKNRLLRAFGSVQAMVNFSADEIATKGRMPKSLAERILLKLRE